MKSKEDSVRKIRVCKKCVKIFKSFPRHKVVKKADRIRKTTTAITLNFDADNNEVSFAPRFLLFKSFLKLNFKF